ncbi:MAG TPA: class I SAM-dependent methyltransferase [Anaerolineales bacterium]|nr:class I SAM-dependent methyltransferase [Anaerolineales bacterium]
MDHTDHVNLLRPANLPQGGTWADFGAGTGAFTLALSELVGLNAEIYAIDRDRGALSRLEQLHRAHFGTSQNIHAIRADFTGALSLPPLDGILMANSLHFYRDKEKLLRHIRKFLKWNGALLLIEYNVDWGNPWVPHPLSFETFQSLAPRAGFSEPQLLEKAPSRFLREFYSAQTHRKEN